MTYSYAKGQCQRSVGSVQKIKNIQTDGRTDGRTEATALHASLLRSVLIAAALKLVSVKSQHDVRVDINRLVELRQCTQRPRIDIFTLRLALALPAAAAAAAVALQVTHVMIAVTSLLSQVNVTHSRAPRAPRHACEPRRQ